MGSQWLGGSGHWAGLMRGSEQGLWEEVGWADGSKWAVSGCEWAGLMEEVGRADGRNWAGLIGGSGQG